MNKFSEGQRVVCIDDRFYNVQNPDGKIKSERPKTQPTKHEILTVDEYECIGNLLGLRFYQYDQHPEGTWWDARMFRPVDSYEIVSDALEEVREMELETV